LYKLALLIGKVEILLFFQLHIVDNGFEHVFNLSEENYGVFKVSTQYKREHRQFSLHVFLSNVNSFRTLDVLPVALLFSEDISAAELVQNKAAWHKSCHIKFSKENWIEHSEREKGRRQQKVVNLKESIEKMACLLCQQSDGNLHEFRTVEAYQSIRNIATEPHNTELMARMEGGDLVAMETKYHLACLTTAIRNCYRSSENQQGKEHDQSSEEDHLKAMAFVDLLTHIENCVEYQMFSQVFSFTSIVWKASLRP